MNGIVILKKLVQTEPDTSGCYSFQNCRIKHSSAIKGIDLYQIAVDKFLGNSLIARLRDKKLGSLAELRELLHSHTATGLGDWVDLSGLIAPKHAVAELMTQIEQDELMLGDIENKFNEWNANFYQYQWEWVRSHLEKVWGKATEQVEVEDVISTIEKWIESVVKLDRLIYDDARKEFDLDAQIGFGADGDATERQQDFENVRGTFESNPFVNEVLKHIQRKSALAEEVIAKLAKIE
jgi:hypothetical protein